MPDTQQTPAVGQPVTITLGLPYGMAWEEANDLEGKHGILIHIDRQEPAPYQVQLIDGGEPVPARRVETITDPVSGLHIATQATRHLAERHTKMTAEYQTDALAIVGRFEEIQEYATRGNMTDTVRAELNRILNQG
jgi:hypothetical protein